MNKFDYKEFKNEMKKRGHEVSKKGDYITIKPDNNYFEYGKGFECAEDVIKGFEDYLNLVWMDHYNTWIYSIRFKVK